MATEEEFLQAKNKIEEAVETVVREYGLTSLEAANLLSLIQGRYADQARNQTAK